MGGKARASPAMRRYHYQYRLNTVDEVVVFDDCGLRVRLMSEGMFRYKYPNHPRPTHRLQELCIPKELKV